VVCTAYTIIWLLLYSNMLKQYSAACTRFTYKMDLIILMLVVVEKVIYQAQSLKQNYSQTKTSHLISPNRDPCVTILSVTV